MIISTRILPRLILAALMLAIIFIAKPASALHIDHGDYAPGQNISVLCTYNFDAVELYDTTSDTHIGYYPCRPTAITITFDGQDGDSYSLLEVQGFSCDAKNYWDCSHLSGIQGEVIFTVQSGGGSSAPVESSVLGTDKNAYAPSEHVQVTCTYRYNTFEIYDTTSGDNVGFYACDTPAIVGFDWVVGHSYSILETVGFSCQDLDYDTCASDSSVLGEVEFVATTDGQGGTAPSDPGTDKTVYRPGEAVAVTCSVQYNTFEVYDLTDGIDGLEANGGNIGHYNCGTPNIISPATVAGHSYVVVEVSGGSCQALDYEQCLGENLRGTYLFHTTGPVSTVDTSSQHVPTPTVKITSPDDGTTFGKTASVDFETTETSKTIIYVSDKLAQWDHLTVNTNDATVVNNS